MFRNYLTIALRHFWTNKSYVIANVVGLAVAIGICILAFYHFAYNFEFNDNYKSSTQNIYRIHKHQTFSGKKYEIASVPFAFAKKIINDVPSIKQRLRLTGNFYVNSRLKVNENVFKDNVVFADSGFFQVFNFTFIKGNASAFQDKSSIIINEKTAKKYFGNAEALGKVITLIYNDKKVNFIVGGIVKDAPINSSFGFTAITRAENFLELENVDENNWADWRETTLFLEIKDPKNIAVIEKLLPKYKKIYNEFNKSEPIDSLSIAKFADMHKNEAVSSFCSNPINKSFVVMISVIALLILLIACFNYTNTSIALSGTRIKEISLRKVMGSQRKHIIIQFLTEHFIISLVSVFLSLAVAEIIMPLYSKLWTDEGADGFEMSINTFIMPFLGFMLVATTLLSGAYPAFYISNLKTSEALRKNLKLKGGNWFTYTLLTIQLTITVAGLGTGIMFAQNMKFIDEANRGYSAKNIISIPINGTDMRDFDLYKSKILQNPDILAVAGTMQHISWGSWQEKTKYNDKEYEATMLPTGDNYLQTMGVKLLEGRYFDILDYSDTNCVIINNEYVKTAGITNPLSQSIVFYNRPFKIVGVVGDFMQHGASSKIKPMIITLKKTGYILMAVRTAPEKLSIVNKSLEKTWLETFPDKYYEGYPQLKMVEQEKRIFGIYSIIFMLVSAISLVLSIVGLYVLIALIINKKTKEIGIRKIMGAPIQSIIYILGKNFIYIFGIAALVGSFAGLAITKQIFDSVFRLDNHVDVTPTLYLLSALVITILAALTISYKVYKAANENPVVCLRNE